MPPWGSGAPRARGRGGAKRARGRGGLGRLEAGQLKSAEVWTRAGGIAATVAMRGSECLRYGTAELFWPVGGWEDQACRGASEKEVYISIE